MFGEGAKVKQIGGLLVVAIFLEESGCGRRKKRMDKPVGDWGVVDDRVSMWLEVVVVVWLGDTTVRKLGGYPG